jgi:hypothetical protein
MDWLEVDIPPSPGGVDVATTIRIATETTELRGTAYIGAAAWHRWGLAAWPHQTDAPLGLSIVTHA